MKRKVSNTCIAVIKNEGKLIMAGDRRASWGIDQAQKMPIPKISKKGELLIGGTGNGYLCSLIVDIIKFPSITKNQSISEYMFTVIPNIITKELIKRGFGTSSKLLKLPHDYSAEIVIGCRGEAYSIIIANDYSDDSSEGALAHIIVDVLNTPYATGCGGQWAWGVLDEHELLRKDSLLKLAPEDSLRRALIVAARNSPGCDNNIDIIYE